MSAPDPRANPLLFGHGDAKARFAEALASGRLHHAWLITGPLGVGKATLAFHLVRLVLGARNDPADPVFRRIAGGAHADLLTIERARDPKTKKLKRDLAVDQVRAIPNFMHLTPAEGGWRVVVVDGAEDMNRNAANALLKILEEPPKRAVLFLTCDAPGRLLPTIRSRCRLVRLDALDDGEMAAAMAALMPDLGGAERDALAAVADGAPGRAVAMADDGALPLVALARDVLGRPAMPVARMYEVADKATKGETAFSTFMALLQSGVADAARAAAREGAGRVMDRPLAEWGEVWHGLGRLQDETERLSLDKRSAVVAGLQLLTKAD